MNALALLLLLLLAPLSWAADSPARSLYDSGDYARAAQAYRAELSETPDDPVRHYNLGNALFKAGKLGPAIASYQRAYDLNPRDADIRYNLDFALKRAGEELVPPGVPAPLYHAHQWLNRDELAGLFCLSAWAFLLLGGLALARPAAAQALTPFAGGALALAAAFGLWWLSARGLSPAPRGVIIASTAELRSGPGESFPVAATVPEGRRVHILSESGEWLEVGVLKEGLSGWTRAATIERL